MKEKKWHRVLAVFFVMVTVLSLLSGCGGKSAEKEAGMNEHIGKPVDGKLLVKIIHELVE